MCAAKIIICTEVKRMGGEKKKKRKSLLVKSGGKLIKDH